MCLVQSVLKEIMEKVVEKVIQVPKETREILVNQEVVVYLEKWLVHQEELDKIHFAVQCRHTCMHDGF